MKTTLNILVLLSLILFAGCGESGDAEKSSQPKTEQQNPNGLTDFQMENGVGPVKEEIELGELKPQLAEEGKQIFRNKCSACHKPTERYIGPAPQGVLERRTPTYVMNMILNPGDMTKKHPVAKKLLQEYMSPMPFQNVSEEQARAIVEYFRTIEMKDSE